MRGPEFFMSTSKLQRQASHLLSIHLGQYTIRENYRPNWLDGLELDFYIEEIRAGIEIQGRQHYEWVPHFHPDYADFLALKARDQKKSIICREMDIVLHYIYEGKDILSLIEDLGKIQFNVPLHPNVIPSLIEEALLENKVTKRWLKQYRQAIRKGQMGRAKRFERQIDGYLRALAG